MREEVEVNITSNEAAERANPMFDNMRRLLLASIGAVAMTADEVNNTVNKLVARGELAQKDGEKVMREVQDRVRQSRPRPDELEQRIETGIEQFLNRLNIPSKRDIDELSTKIAQLNARVEELRKS
jgi:poly(hydroxyalkanoate) granule-associated protein